MACDFLIAVALGLLTIGLGCKGFTRAGIPLTKTVKIKGASGILVGIVCIVLGLGFLALSVVPFVVEALRASSK